MRKVFFIFCFMISISYSIGQKLDTKKEFIVTKSMAIKIADKCLYGNGYALAVFYESNSKYLSNTDIARGTGRTILNSLDKYPKYAENFIRMVYDKWGFNGLRQIGFTDLEISKSKKIISKSSDEKSTEAILQ